jgi:hypothetical protein
MTASASALQSWKRRTEVPDHGQQSAVEGPGAVG